MKNRILGVLQTPSSRILGGRDLAQERRTVRFTQVFFAWAKMCGDGSVVITLFRRKKDCVVKGLLYVYRYTHSLRKLNISPRHPLIGSLLPTVEFIHHEGSWSAKRLDKTTGEPDSPFYTDWYRKCRTGILYRSHCIDTIQTNVDPETQAVTLTTTTPFHSYGAMLLMRSGDVVLGNEFSFGTGKKIDDIQYANLRIRRINRVWMSFYQFPRVLECIDVTDGVNRLFVYSGGFWHQLVIIGIARWYRTLFRLTLQATSAIAILIFVSALL